MVKTTFNYYLLDDLINGFTTANVLGRGVIVPEINSLKVSGSDGIVITDSSLPARTLEVQYLLKRTNANEFQQSLRKLNRLLYSDHDVKIRFSDESGWFYEGRVTAHTPPSEDNFTGFGSFTITCPKPFRYQDEAITTIGDVLKMPRVNKIEFTPDAETNQIVISDEFTSNQIVINDSFTADDKLEIDLTTNKVYKNNAPITSKIDYKNTSLSSFRSADKLKLKLLQGSGNVTIKYNEREL